ncbi:hypothetical protein [Micromonospora sp. NPDC049102]|uniref:hypothetical protein n=1 Tax=Micromonospora sp. NPDC049102 TaxID=3364265 RepID=UPI00371324B1
MHTYIAAPPEAMLHRLLLRAATHMPDEALVKARLALAEGDVATAAEVVADANPELHQNDRQLLGLYLPEGVEPPVPVSAAVTGIAFTPVEPGSVPAEQMPPVLDLTSGPEPASDAAMDAADRAAVAEAARLAGAVALWRSWRGPGERVYVLELDAPVTELAEATGAVMQALIATGVELPLVESYATGTEQPAHLQRARASSALLWAAEVVAPIELARVFDSVDAVGGPRFADDHGRMSDPERRQLLRYLDQGVGVLETTDLMADVVDPYRGDVVPMSYRTDGTFVWTDTVTYYLREYGLAPDPSLVQQAQRNTYRVPQVGDVALHRALAELFRPVDDDPVWTA